jgi:transposase
MVRRKCTNALELDTKLTQAALGVKQGVYKTAWSAANALGLNKNSVLKRVNGGLSRSQARQQQQKLSPAQEKVLVKWIKELTISGYSPGHRLLKEIAEELQSKRTYDLDQCRG